MAMSVPPCSQSPREPFERMIRDQYGCDTRHVEIFESIVWEAKWRWITHVHLFELIDADQPFDRVFGLRNNRLDGDGRILVPLEGNVRDADDAARLVFGLAHADDK
jgi:hypothetical protein